MRTERMHYTADEKVAILRRHLLIKVPVSDLCEELGLQPTVFYRWQKKFFENGAAAFQSTERPPRQAEEKQERSGLIPPRLWRSFDRCQRKLIGERLKRLSLRGSKFVLTTSLVFLSSSASLCQISKRQNQPEPNQIVEVICASDPAQSYALYLPSAYTPAKRWPIIYFFDPGGRGRRPLDLYKDIAETYGFIFVGSNNSRNFSSNESEIVNAIWKDTHQKLALDERRIYSSGFSGGARVAGAMALNCSSCEMAGVIAHGAGYPDNKIRADNLLYFFAVGDRDFNWPEVITARREREQRGAPYRVRTFAGEHQWAPRDIMEDAVQWLVLKAMQAGNLAPDTAFIDRMFLKTRAEADDAERRHDSIAQFTAYGSLVSDFSGLKDAGNAASTLAALKDSAALKAALKAEHGQIDEQLAIERAISPKLNSYLDGSASDMNALRIEILQAMGGIKDQAAHSSNEAKRLVASRTFESILVEGLEAGQQELEARHFEKAEACFQLMSDATKDPWPLLLLADTHASSGNMKLAIKDLQEAVRRGLKNADVIESDKKLENLKSEPEFQKLLAGIGKN